MNARRGVAGWGTLGIASLAAFGVIRFGHPPVEPPRVVSSLLAAETHAGPSLNAFGASGSVKLRFSMPGDSVEFPLDVSGDPSSLQYSWVPTYDTSRADDARPLVGSTVQAPSNPGFYRLAVTSSDARTIVSEPTLAVMVPFAQKVGKSMLNGYKIGLYLAERRKRGNYETPSGFLQVGETDVELPVSTHFRLGDFITHDQASVWPKYVALNPRILDKVELVLAKLAQHTGQQFTDASGQPADVSFNIHSGFRTPSYNRRVRRAATDSRHQYGDAMDLAIDADGDGRITIKDEVLVARAVDEVETEHPELVGGLGLYTSRRYKVPYVHIDTRGHRARWRG